MAGGRPTKITPERLEGILYSISNRIPYELAAEVNGIDESTLYDWINKGKADNKAGIDSVLAQFSKDIKKCEQERIIYHMDKITANVDRWQGDAWILERRWHKYFGANALLREQEERLKAIEERLNGDSHGREETKE